MIELAFVGKIVDIQDIPNSDFISSATVICGKGGKWKGVVRKVDFSLGDRCVVYLPDALLPDTNPDKQFLHDGRVRMRRFRGAPSEVFIMPMSERFDVAIGTDLTQALGVTKYFKPIPSNLQGNALGSFPDFIPKTDELNFQRHPELVESLHGKPYYVTEKADGSSTTAFKYNGHFGLCSRNLELARSDNGYWKVAKKYKVEERLPEGYAIQWETCGPGIQKNRMGFTEIDGLMFSGYNIKDHKYLDMGQLIDLSSEISFPRVKFLDQGMEFNKDTVETLGEGKYPGSGQEREGVVVRSQENLIEDHKPVSFKVINLNYEA